MRRSHPKQIFLNHFMVSFLLKAKIAEKRSWAAAIDIHIEPERAQHQKGLRKKAIKSDYCDISPRFSYLTRRDNLEILVALNSNASGDKFA